MASLPAGLLAELFLARIPEGQQQRAISDIILKLRPLPGVPLDIAMAQLAVELVRAYPNVSRMFLLLTATFYSVYPRVFKVSGH